ncbi:MAG TPA: hypothetical protein VGN10_00720 [Pyrinomonadaceae bacterium]|jgi:hypothetical protein
MGNPLPALCRSCGLFFAATNLFGGTGTIQFKNVRTNCPNCNGIADILDGTYQLMGDAVRILSSTYVPPVRLRALADALTKAKQESAGPEEVKETIKEHAPELKRLSDLIPQKRSELYALIAVLVAFIGIILNQRGRVTKEEVESIVKREISKPVAQSVQGPPQPNRAQRRAQRSKARRAQPRPNRKRPTN